MAYLNLFQHYFNKLFVTFSTILRDLFKHVIELYSVYLLWVFSSIAFLIIFFIHVAFSGPSLSVTVGISFDDGKPLRKLGGSPGKGC